MITIDVTEVLAAADKAKRSPKPVPEIRLVSGARLPRKKRVKKKPVVVDPDVEKALPEPQSELLQSLYREFSALKVERNRLSTEIAHLVENGAPQERLKEQYDKIEGYRPRLQDLYDKIEYVSQHGELPVVPETPEEPETLASLKLKKESLIDERYKLRKKLQKRVAKNPQRCIDWELRLAQADIEYQDICERIKQMEGKA